MSCSDTQIPLLTDKVIVNRCWVLTALRQQLFSILCLIDCPICERDIVSLFKQETDEELSALANSLSYRTVAGLLQSLELSSLLKTDFAKTDSDQWVCVYTLIDKSQADKEVNQKPVSSCILPKCVSPRQHYGHETINYPTQDFKKANEKLSSEELLQIRCNTPKHAMLDESPATSMSSRHSSVQAPLKTRDYNISPFIFEPFEVASRLVSDYEVVKLADDFKPTFEGNIQKVAMLISFIVMYRQKIQLSDLDKAIEDIFGRRIRATELLEPNWSYFIKKYCWQVEMLNKEGKEIQLVWNDKEMIDDFAEFCAYHPRNQQNRN
uniref:Uncharacterized protein n=1 Tax=Ditylenchus dipsaci TaxID=166011 RepID=A0A915D797_9BILA